MSITIKRNLYINQKTNTQVRLCELPQQHFQVEKSISVKESWCTSHYKDFNQSGFGR